MLFSVLHKSALESLPAERPVARGGICPSLPLLATLQLSAPNQRHPFALHEVGRCGTPYFAGGEGPASQISPPPSRALAGHVKMTVLLASWCSGLKEASTCARHDKNTGAAVCLAARARACLAIPIRRGRFRESTGRGLLRIANARAVDGIAQSGTVLAPRYVVEDVLGSGGKRGHP